MNKSLFDIIFNNILYEENLTGQNTNILYKDIGIGIIPAKFQIPNKYDWDLIMQYCKLPVQKVIIISSNVSKQKIINRKLSKTNLTKFSDILQKIESNTDLDISNIKKEVLTDIDNLSYKDLLYYCNNDIIPLLNDYEEIKQTLFKYLKNLKNILFKNVSKIDINIIKEILNLYASIYNVTNILQIRVSQQQSPFNDMINIISTNCNNCDIYINTDLEKNNSLFDDLYKRMKVNNINNIIIPHKIFVDYNKITNDLERENFPDKLSQEQFKKIKELITNEK